MRQIMVMKALSQLKTLILISFLGAWLLGWTMFPSTTWAQTPRPTLTPEPTATVEPTSTPIPTPTSDSGPEPAPASPSVHTGPTLIGKVINVVTGQGEVDVPVVFSTGAVSVEVITNENGEYAFNLGEESGVLNVAPRLGSDLRPLTTDVAVRPRPRMATVVNLGVAPAGMGTPPIVPIVEVSPPPTGAGQDLTVVVTIKNILPESISEAMVTQWLPAAFVPVSIHSTLGSAYFVGNLGIVELGRLDAGSQAVIEVVASASGTAGSAPTLKSTVSLFYRESVAGQARVTGSGNGAPPTVLPATGVGLPVVGLILIVVALFAGWMRRRIGRTSPVA